MITKHGQPIAPRRVIVDVEWQAVPSNDDMDLVNSSITFESDALFYGFAKQDIGISGIAMNTSIPLPPAEYIPKFDNANIMLRWVIGYLYETQENKVQLGAD
jgi:hypothetical protein